MVFHFLHFYFGRRRIEIVKKVIIMLYYYVSIDFSAGCGVCVNDCNTRTHCLFCFNFNKPAACFSDIVHTLKTHYNRISAYGFVHVPLWKISLLFPLSNWILTCPNNKKQNHNNLQQHIIIQKVKQTALTKLIFFGNKLMFKVCKFSCYRVTLHSNVLAPASFTDLSRGSMSVSLKALRCQHHLMRSKL